jgi:hypothetical protein
MMRQEQVSHGNAPAFDPTLESSRTLRIVNAHLVSVALLLTLLPIAIFAAHLSPVPQALLLLGVALCAFLFALGWEGGAMLSSPVDWRSLAGCATLALALCLLSGEYHLFFSPYDWFVQDSGARLKVERRVCWPDYPFMLDK